MGLSQQPSSTRLSSDKRRFQVTLKQQSAPLTLQAANGAVKALWVAEIERVLWSHFASLKAEALKRQQQKQQELQKQQQQLQQQISSIEEDSDSAASDGLEAVVDFASQDAAMLPLRRGEFLVAINTDSENYWLVENREGRRGYAHRQYLRPVRQISGGVSANSFSASNGLPPRRGSVVTTAV
ncbi:hypothetical protein BOX15_Mlig008194g1 [Macrostomum lignano]|nr:hypothetical protein BOX15_Mlig008194g1 [Macrostomum lignano]